MNPNNGLFPGRGPKNEKLKAEGTHVKYGLGKPASCSASFSSWSAFVLPAMIQLEVATVAEAEQ